MFVHRIKVNNIFINPIGYCVVGDSDELNVMDEVKKLRVEAVSKFSAQQFEEAEMLFSEILEVMQSIYPPDHPECVKAEKSILMVQQKKRAALRAASGR